MIALAPSIDARSCERFDNLVTVRPDGCWQWTGSTDKGYGHFGLKVDGRWRTVKAHRFSYERQIGPIGDMQIDHLCRNRACVNPAHLEPVDNRTNTLRGQAPVAFNARVTHCPKGHEYTPGNTTTKRTVSGVGRECRKCNLARMRHGRHVEGGFACTTCGIAYGTQRGLSVHLSKFHGRSEAGR
jgi:hypothetical protein